MSITYKGVKNGPWTMDRTGGIQTSRILVFYFSAAETAVEIAQQTQIPELGTAHPDDPKLLLSSIAVSEPMEGDQVKSAKYEVTLNYQRIVSSGGSMNTTDRNKAPWDRAPYDISMSAQEYSVGFEKAYQAGDEPGNPSLPVLNPAGDPYEESTTIYTTLLRFSYNLETFDSDWVGRFVDSINDTAVNVIDVAIPKYRGRIKNLAPSYQLEYDNAGELRYSFWRVDVEIEIYRKNIQKDILARGLFFLDSGDVNKKLRIYFDPSATGSNNIGARDDLGSNAAPVDVPIKLDTDGTILATGAAPYYDSYEDKWAGSWEPLSLPETRIVE